MKENTGMPVAFHRVNNVSLNNILESQNSECIDSSYSIKVISVIYFLIYEIPFLESTAIYKLG